ncbi:hypothetical protein LEP1GSC047_1606 [Leptospira inadai serovar Lyme str. 10]|uniref:Uncharacterized protein n=2 Tax=Leptospira inadai serovar Lyme TaxID=293084 RepID=V6H994_9LEPT|nr:hypothetical protein [Leptospira inadai]EQA35482.1 hypothetical protein LEP1GSC047_1606 [Leptospira inadai serovar Lyme str. 10]PNV73087.1 hypothetical protein BES34_017915 [Leptospira inadai serovar Lyme]
MEERSPDIIEIKDTSVNVRELMEEIESRLARRPVTKEELEKLSRWKFAPESPEGYREFDAAETAHLFEKGIAPPKFTNPKFKFIRGPLRWVFISLVEFYAFLDKKLSENRTRAFYSVLNELILLRGDHEKLKRKFERFYNEFIELNYSLRREIKPEFLWSSEFLYEEETLEESEKLLLSMISPGNSVLVLNPEWGKFLKHLLKAQIEFRCVTWNANHYNFIKEQVFNSVELLSFDELLPQPPLPSKVVLPSNLCFLPNWVLEKLFRTLAQKAAPSTEFLFRYSNFSNRFASPFQPVLLTQVGESSLREFLRKLGFKNVVETKVGDGFAVLSFRK